MIANCSAFAFGAWLLVLTTTGCGGQRANGQIRPKNAAKETTPNQPATKTFLIEVGHQMEALAQKEFRRILPQLQEALRVPAESLQMEKGITFTSVRLSRLDEAAIDDIEANGVEFLADGGSVIGVFPIVIVSKKEGRVVDSVLCQRAGESQKFIAREVGIDEEHNERNTFTKQVEEARRKDLERHIDTPPDAYRGLIIHGLNKSFLYVERNGAQQMIPIELDPTNEFVPGVAQPTSSVIAKLRAHPRTPSPSGRGPG